MSHAFLAFTEALTAALANEAKIARRGWNGADQHVCKAVNAVLKIPGQYRHELVEIDGFLVLVKPASKTQDNPLGQGFEHVPWVPSMGDMMACDWMVLSKDGAKPEPPFRMRTAGADGGAGY